MQKEHHHDNTGNLAYLKRFESKPVETEKIHLDTANGTGVKTAVGHNPHRKP